jgi:hypothetical protein
MMSLFNFGISKMYRDSKSHRRWAVEMNDGRHYTALMRIDGFWVLA